MGAPYALMMVVLLHLPALFAALVGAVLIVAKGGARNPGAVCGAAGLVLIGSLQMTGPVIATALPMFFTSWPRADLAQVIAIVGIGHAVFFCLGLILITIGLLRGCGKVDATLGSTDALRPRGTPLR